MKCPAVAGQW